MRTHERIYLAMSWPEIIEALTEGHPGATRVVALILTRGPLIDPDNMLKQLGPMHSLDSIGLFGSDIWQLWCDVCGEDLGRTMAVLRAWDCSFVSAEAIRAAIAGAPLDVDALCARVKQRIPTFAVN